MKDIGDILSSSLTAATWGFDFCSVELTLWAVIDWAASTSAFEDTGENCSSSTPPGFQVALGLNPWNRGSWGQERRWEHAGSLIALLGDSDSLFSAAGF